VLWKAYEKEEPLFGEKSQGKTSQKKCLAMAERVKDPVCGMETEKDAAVEPVEHRGKIFYFYRQKCKEKFENEATDVPLTTVMGAPALGDVIGHQGVEIQAKMGRTHTKMVKIFESITGKGGVV